MATIIMKHGFYRRTALAAMVVLGTQTVLAQEPGQAMPGMDAGAMQGMKPGVKQEAGAMPGMGMTPGTMPGMKPEAKAKAAPMSGMAQGDMQGQGTMSNMPQTGATAMAGGNMQMAGMNDNAMQAGTGALRDPHAYSGGYTLVSGPYAMQGPRQLHLADEHNFGSLLVDRLEAVRTAGNTSGVYDLQAWFGRDYDRAVLKAEGSYDNHTLAEASTELLWGHAVAPFWDTLLGVRYDSGDAPNRTWLAFGVQGLAPYWFEVDATGYLGDQGRSALKLVAAYDVLFSQRLILQPRLEANLYGKDDRERGIGSGLSDLTAGLRLRYEIRREFAPYIGVERSAVYGTTADYARQDGLETSETRTVAGIRFWF